MNRRLFAAFAAFAVIAATLERYLAAARTVSRLAVGSPPPAVAGETYRLATDMQQHDRMDRLPFGTRGGALVTHLFPQEAEYDIQVELGRPRRTVCAIVPSWNGRCGGCSPTPARTP